LHSFPKYRRRTCESCHSLQRNPNQLNCLAPASSSSTRRPSSSSSQECYKWSKECVSRHTYLSLCAVERKTLQSNNKQHSIDMMMISKR
jgi:invasion protein IalB